MKSTALLLAIAISAPLVHAQGSGTPSSSGQAESKQGADSAERAVEGRHEKVVEHYRARTAKRAAKAASAASSQ